MPHLRILLINFILVIALKIMEKWPQKLLIEKHKLLNLVFLQPYRIAILAFKQIFNPNFFIFVFRYDPRPSDPLKGEESFLFESEYGRIQHTSTLPETYGTILLFGYANWKSKAHKNKAIIFANFYIGIHKFFFHFILGGDVLEVIGLQDRGCFGDLLQGVFAKEVFLD